MRRQQHRLRRPCRRWDAPYRPPASNWSPVYAGRDSDRYCQRHIIVKCTLSLSLSPSLSLAISLAISSRHLLSPSPLAFPYISLPPLHLPLPPFHTPTLPFLPSYLSPPDFLIYSDSCHYPATYPYADVEPNFAIIINTDLGVCQLGTNVNKVIFAFQQLLHRTYIARVFCQTAAWKKRDVIDSSHNAAMAYHKLLQLSLTGKVSTISWLHNVISVIPKAA